MSGHLPECATADYCDCCDGCDIDPWAPAIHYGSCPLAPAVPVRYCPYPLEWVEEARTLCANMGWGVS